MRKPTEYEINELNKMVDDYLEGKITYDEFGRRNRKVSIKLNGVVGVDVDTELTRKEELDMERTERTINDQFEKMLDRMAEGPYGSSYIF